MEKGRQEACAIRFRLSLVPVWGFIAGLGMAQVFLVVSFFWLVDEEGGAYFASRPIECIALQVILLAIAFGGMRGLYRAASLTLTPVGILIPGWFSSRFFRWGEIQEIEHPRRTGLPEPLRLKGKFGVRVILTALFANPVSAEDVILLYFEAEKRNTSPHLLLEMKSLEEMGKEREFLPDLESQQYRGNDNLGNVSPESYRSVKWGSLVLCFCVFLIGLFVLPGHSLFEWFGWIILQLAFIGLSIFSHRVEKKLSTAYRVGPEGIEAFSTTSGRIEFLEWEKIVEFQDRAGSGMAKVIAEDGCSIHFSYWTLDFLLLEAIIFQKASRMQVTGKRWVVPAPIPENHPEGATLSWPAPAPISEGYSENAMPSDKDLEPIRPSRLGRRSIT